MKKWVQFYQINEGKLVTALGSDGILPLDGRLSSSNCKAKAKAQAFALRKVKPFYTGFAIHCGSLKTPTYLVPYRDIVR